MKTDEQINPL